MILSGHASAVTAFTAAICSRESASSSNTPVSMPL